MSSNLEGNLMTLKKQNKIKKPNTREGFNMTALQCQSPRLPDPVKEDFSAQPSPFAGDGLRRHFGSYAHAPPTATTHAKPNANIGERTWKLLRPLARKQPPAHHLLYSQFQFLLWNISIYSG